MANEPRGKLAEALVTVALRTYASPVFLRGRDLFSHQKPPGFLVVPDLSVGTSPLTPEVVLAISAVESVKESNRKFWRNIAELIDCKRLPKPALFVCVNFGGFKRDLELLQAIAADQSFSDDGEVTAWIGRNAPAVETLTEPETLAFVRAQVAASGALQAACGHLAQRLASTLPAPRIGLPAVAELARIPRTKRLPYERETEFRHALAALVIAPDAKEIQDHIFGRGELGACLPDLRALGLIAPSVRWTCGEGLKAAYAAALLAVGVSACRAVAKGAPIRKMRALAGPVLETVRRQQVVDALLARWADVGTPSSLFTFLFPGCTDPAANLTSLSLSDVQRTTIPLLVEVLKKSSKKAQKTGYSQLLERVRTTRADAARVGQIAQVAAGVFGTRRLSPSASTETIRLGLQELRNGPSPVNRFTLTASDLFVLLVELADQLRLVPAAVARQVLDPAAVVKSEVFERVRNYKDFEPLWHVVEDALRASRMPFRFERRFPNILTDASAERLDPRSGRTEFIQCRETLIHVKSAFGAANVGHKVKELSARSAFTRVAIDSAGQVCPRPAVRKLILVIDGTWKSEDLEALWARGVDEFYYPDEMSSLVKAIV